MQFAEKINANPTVFEGSCKRRLDVLDDGDTADPIDRDEIYDLIRDINDPEHPLTLEQLNVAQYDLVEVDDRRSRVRVQFTPTVPHCSVATVIGLCIQVKLMRSLPKRFKIDVSITPGTHANEEAVNKQIGDKERVAAALENGGLLRAVNNCIANTDTLRLPEPATP
jgi:metal-sulfur cluster biosynthetic enzyme